MRRRLLDRSGWIRLVAGAGFLVMAAGSAGAVSVTYDLPVFDMGEFAINGDPFLGGDSGARVVWGSSESRVAMAFDLSSVSSAAVIQSATLNYHLNGLQTADFGATGPVLGFFATPGDLVATASDTQGGGPRVGTSPELLNTGFYAQPLTVSPIQNIVSGGAEAVNIWSWSETANNLGADIHWNAFPESNQPRLSLVAEIDRQGTLSATPAVDAQATNNAGVWTVDPTSQGLTVSRSVNATDPLEERAILEFAAPALPQGAIVTGGRLILDPRFISFSSDGSAASVFAHLYAGDGQADLTDVGALTLPASRSPDIVGGTDLLTIELDRRGLANAYDIGADHLGTLLSYAPENFLDADFYSVEGAAGATFFNAPQLELDYAILTDALLGDADLDEDVDLTDANILVNAYTGSLAGGRGDAIWLDGDFDGDGDVDFADAMALRSNFTGDPAALAAALSAVPEPSLGLPLLLLYSLARRRIVA